MGTDETDQSSTGGAETRYLAPPPPPDQVARLAALRTYEILDTPVEGAFEDITRIAALVCDVPIAVVNLIDEHRQWFKSEIGLGVRETPLDTSFCAHALLQDNFMEIPDTLQDPRFKGNPLVNGGPRLRFYAGALIKTPQGHALGTVCVLDNRPRQLNQEQRRVLRALARQAMTQMELRRTLINAAHVQAYRGRLMAVAGHDLKQPLTTITMMLDMLSATTPADRRYIKAAKEAAARLSQDLDELAKASKGEGENNQVEMQSVRIDTLIKEIVAAWSLAAKRKGLRMAARTIDAQVRTNVEMLRTILDNLIGNAIKYTAKGSVTVECRKADDGLWVDVADTGMGIPETRRKDLFKAFKQFDTNSDGLGLGLSIVKRTADMLGYELSVADGQERGTTFSVHMPS